MCARAHVCVRACMRVCVCVCVRARVRAFVAVCVFEAVSCTLFWLTERRRLGMSDILPLSEISGLSSDPTSPPTLYLLSFTSFLSHWTGLTGLLTGCTCVPYRVMEIIVMKLSLLIDRFRTVGSQPSAKGVSVQNPHSPARRPALGYCGRRN